MIPAETLRAMYDKGLGDLPILCCTEEKVLFGNLVASDGRLVLKDRGFLKGVKPYQVSPCWEVGIVGALCMGEEAEWDSLTFLGAEHCAIPENLNTTRRGLLNGAVSDTGDILYRFRGSIYRAAKLMLDSFLLPAVLLMDLKSSEGRPGLAVCDFRTAALPLQTFVLINDFVRTSIEKKLEFDVEDVDVGSEDFQKMFGSYLTAE